MNVVHLSLVHLLLINVLLVHHLFLFVVCLLIHCLVVHHLLKLFVFCHALFIHRLFIGVQISWKVMQITQIYSLGVLWRGRLGSPASFVGVLQWVMAICPAAA